MVKSSETNIDTHARGAFHLGNPRTFIWVLLVIAAIATFGIWQAQQLQTTIQQDQQALARNATGQHSFVLAELGTFDAAVVAAKADGVDTTTLERTRLEVVALLQSGSDLQAATNLLDLKHQLQALRDTKKVADQAAAEAARPSVVNGTVKTTSGKAISQVLIELRTDATIASATTDVTGQYRVEALAGTYTLKATKSGYVTKEQADVTLVAGGSQIIDITLATASSSTSSSTKSSSSASSSTSSSSSSTSDSTANSTYSRQTVETNRGNFTADIMTFDLTAGAKVRTAVGEDDDCVDNCAVKSLMSYVSGEGGTSGINGTYFCPADYGASCDGQKNAFFWKVWKTSADKNINTTNGLGEYEATMAFTSSGHAQYFHSWNAWKTSGFATYASVNSKPRLIEGGSNVLSDGDMDDKQRTTKSNRGALGLKGQTFYAVIAKSATVPDLAAVMEALGVDNAMNIDGGGSSAMVYKGSYKVGPGRSIPNAIVIVH